MAIVRKLRCCEMRRAQCFPIILGVESSERSNYFPKKFHSSRATYKTYCNCLNNIPLGSHSMRRTACMHNTVWHVQHVKPVLAWEREAPQRFPNLIFQDVLRFQDAPRFQDVNNSFFLFSKIYYALLRFQDHLKIFKISKVLLNPQDVDFPFC